jgi:minor extracellular serine protease Vpr
MKLLWLFHFLAQAHCYHSNTTTSMSQRRQKQLQERKDFFSHPHRRLLSQAHARHVQRNVNMRRVTIHCRTPALYACPDCHDRVMVEQWAVAQELYKRLPTAHPIATTHSLVNALYYLLPKSDNDTAVDAMIRSIPGVQQVYPAEDYTATVMDNDTTVAYLGVASLRTDACVQGRGIRVAILDSGVDYTHEAFGGRGTLRAYRAAYGTDASSVENTQRDNLFPTDRVVAGYDFVGDRMGPDDPDSAVQPDEDPMDAPNGHGTLVAGTVLSMAPQVEIVAVKVCMNNVVGGCPEYSVIQGLEYILDLNQDGSKTTSDKVDLVNCKFKK